MDRTQTLEQWEREKGYIVKGDVDINKQLSEAEFEAIPHGERHGVNHADRIKFLQDNGYEVTRENMINPNLSHRSE